MRGEERNVSPVNNQLRQTLAGNYQHCYTARCYHLVTCTYTHNINTLPI